MSESLQPQDPLESFCKAVVSRYRENWPPSEEQLAEEFASFFGLGPLVVAESMQLCQKLGVQVSYAALPEGVCGINGRHGPKCEIVLSTNEYFPGGKFHTLLHELRELLEYTFCDLGHPIAHPEQLEIHAEAFAHAVRVDGAKKAMELFFKGASTVETDWKRWLAYLGSFVLGLFCVMACGMHSHLEDAMIRHRQDTLR